MKNKSKELFVALAMETGLRFSEENGALWGELQGYPVVIYLPNENYFRLCLEAPCMAERWISRIQKSCASL